ncbi:MAG: hypothetical protein QNJ22_07070 [Desulfosarcinaceae bacterium]|nr:hypothetical protein [Desulfosarcinaceae bacterium]
MENMALWMKAAVLLGWVLLVAMSCDDFRKNVRKSKHRWQYYLAGFIFVVFNAFAYTLLLHVVMPMPVSAIFVGKAPVTGDHMQLLTPILAAVVYFGAGAGTFRLGPKEIRLNKVLIDLLQNMFSYHRVVSQDITYSNAVAEETYRTLKQRADTLRSQAEYNKWDLLNTKWETFSEDDKMLSEQIRYLNTIDADLGRIREQWRGPSEARDQLTAVIGKVGRRVGDLRRSLIRKLQKYLVAFAFKNFRDDAFLEDFLVKIEVLNPDGGDPDPQPPNIITRSLVMGFMFGLCFGPLFCIMKGLEAANYCFLGATALMLFTGFISFGIHTASWFKAMTWAAAGGYLAHLHWIVTETWIQEGTLMQLELTVAFWMAPMLGLFFGIVTALLLFALKYWLGRRFGGVRIRYLTAAVAGVCAYPLVYASFYFRQFDLTNAILTSFIGAIAMLAMALSVNVGMRAADPEADFQLVTA